jgi:hypothetical protein
MASQGFRFYWRWRSASAARINQKSVIDRGEQRQSVVVRRALRPGWQARHQISQATVGGGCRGDQVPPNWRAARHLPVWQ